MSPHSLHISDTEAHLPAYKGVPLGVLEFLGHKPAEESNPELKQLQEQFGAEFILVNGLVVAVSTRAMRLLDKNYTQSGVHIVPRDNTAENTHEN